jgi:hypothetical protein
MKIDLKTAKALLKVLPKPATYNSALNYIEVSGEEDLTRYTITNGCVLLTFTQRLEDKQEETEILSLQELKTFVQSKGFSPLSPAVEGDSDFAFPDWRAVLPDTTLAVSKIGVDLAYLKMMHDISKALGVGQTWGCEFSGDLGPMKWSYKGPLNGDYEEITFILMPVRLD